MGETTALVPARIPLREQQEVTFQIQSTYYRATQRQNSFNVDSARINECVIRILNKLVRALGSIQSKPRFLSGT